MAAALCVDLITSIASANSYYLQSVSGVWNRQSLAASFLSPDRVQRNQILKQGGFLLRSAPVPNLPRRHFYKSCSILQQFVTPHDSSIIRTAANAMSKSCGNGARRSSSQGLICCQRRKRRRSTTNTLQHPSHHHPWPGGDLRSGSR